MHRFRFTTTDVTYGLQQDVCEFTDTASARTSAARFTSEVLRDVGAALYDQPIRVVVTDEADEMCWDIVITAVEGPGAFPKRG